VVSITGQAGYDHDITFNSNGKILLISPTETRLERYSEAYPILRVSYSAMTATEICIDQVVAVMDDLHESISGTNDGCVAPPAEFYGKLFLEGAYDAGQMSSDLLSASLLPLEQPFNTPSFLNYAGTERFYDIADIPSTVIDWVLVELRAAGDITQVVARKAGLLNADGTIIDFNGDNGVRFMGISSGNYNVAVFARGHLGVATVSPLNLNTTSAYDFSTGWSAVFGFEQTKEVAAGVYACYAGDVDANGVINNLDFNIWMNDNAAFGEYLTYDMDFNTAANNLDFNLWYSNRSKYGEINMQ